MAARAPTHIDGLPRRASMGIFDSGVVGLGFQSRALGRRTAKFGHIAAGFTGAFDSFLFIEQAAIASAGKCRVETAMPIAILAR